MEERRRNRAETWQGFYYISLTLRCALSEGEHIFKDTSAHEKDLESAEIYFENPIPVKPCTLCVCVCSHLFEEASWVLADLCEAGNDVVEVEVGQGGAVAALPLHLQQQQVPAVQRRQNALLLPTNARETKTVRNIFKSPWGRILPINDWHWVSSLIFWISLFIPLIDA